MCIAEPHGEMSGVALWVVGRGGEGRDGGSRLGVGA